MKSPNDPAQTWLAAMRLAARRSRRLWSLFKAVTISLCLLTVACARADDSAGNAAEPVTSQFQIQLDEAEHADAFKSAIFQIRHKIAQFPEGDKRLRRENSEAGVFFFVVEAEDALPIFSFNLGESGVSDWVFTLSSIEPRPVHITLSDPEVIPLPGGTGPSQMVQFKVGLSASCWFSGDRTRADCVRLIDERLRQQDAEANTVLTDDADPDMAQELSDPELSATDPNEHSTSPLPEAVAEAEEETPATSDAMPESATAGLGAVEAAPSPNHRPRKWKMKTVRLTPVMYSGGDKVKPLTIRRTCGFELVYAGAKGELIHGPLALKFERNGLTAQLDQADYGFRMVFEPLQKGHAGVSVGESDTSGGDATKVAVRMSHKNELTECEFDGVSLATTGGHTDGEEWLAEILLPPDRPSATQVFALGGAVEVAGLTSGTAQGSQPLTMDFATLAFTAVHRSLNKREKTSTPRAFVLSRADGRARLSELKVRGQSNRLDKASVHKLRDSLGAQNIARNSDIADVALSSADPQPQVLGARITELAPDIVVLIEAKSQSQRTCRATDALHSKLDKRFRRVRLVRIVGIGEFRRDFNDETLRPIRRQSLIHHCNGNSENTLTLAVSLAQVEKDNLLNEFNEQLQRVLDQEIGR